jgi:hypothetical protein
VRLKNENKYYKERFLALKKQCILEMTSTVDKLTIKHEDLLQGNTGKMEQFKKDMEKKLQVIAIY